MPSDCDWFILLLFIRTVWAAISFAPLLIFVMSLRLVERKSITATVLLLAIHSRHLSSVFSFSLLVWGGKVRSRPDEEDGVSVCSRGTESNYQQKLKLLVRLNVSDSFLRQVSELSGKSQSPKKMKNCPAYSGVVWAGLVPPPGLFWRSDYSCSSSTRGLSCSRLSLPQSWALNQPLWSGGEGGVQVTETESCPVAGLSSPLTSAHLHKLLLSEDLKFLTLSETFFKGCTVS